MTSLNIENISKLPVSGMDDPKLTHPTSKFKVATYKDSIYSNTFKKSEKASWKRLGQFMEPYNFGKFAEAYNEFMEGSLSGAIIDDVTLWWGWKNNRYCDVEIAANILTRAMGFALPKGSSWNAPISYFLRKYEGNGELEKMSKKYMSSKCSNKSENKPKQFNLLYLSGACILLFIGVFVSCIVFCLEQLYIKLHTKRRQNVTGNNLTSDDE